MNSHTSRLRKQTAGKVVDSRDLQARSPYLRGRVSVLEIVFVGQYEVCICLDFGDFFFSLLATKLIGLRTGCQFFKKCLFFRHPAP